MIIISYYTKNYAPYAKRLMESLKKHSLLYVVEEINSLGSWQKNTQYKPTYILDKLNIFPGHSIVYVDADAVFLNYPVLFEELTCDIGLHVLDHNTRKPEIPKKELLSGTIFFKSTDRSRELVSSWIKGCERQPSVWDQRVLEQIIGSDFFPIPQEYCTIFDDVKQPKDPVIVHYQASRKERLKRGI